MRRMKFICVMPNFHFMSIIKRRYFLRESERKDFLRKFTEEFGVSPERIFGVKPKIEVAFTDKSKIFIINGRPVLMDLKGDLVPTLIFEEILQNLPKVIVDMGAIPHVCNGADIMAPGIVRIEGEFKEGAFALVLDEKHGKAIAVVKALLSSEKIKTLERGKVFENLHYVGDLTWKIIKEKLMETGELRPKK